MSNQQVLLLRLEYLGFRFHGWQTQPGWTTLEGLLRKTLSYVLPETRIRLLGAGRTDARVSASDFAVQCILSPPVDTDLERFKGAINRNLPPDMRLLSVTVAPERFNVITDVKSKTYAYLFAFGPKPHPYCAPFLGYFHGDLDIPEMTRAAGLFEGTHYFDAFIAGKAAERSKRTIHNSVLLPNNRIQASFFPEHSYEFRVVGKGFGRYQVRLMMAALVAIGRGEAGAQDLRHSLRDGQQWPVGSIAPGSGLHLTAIEYG